MSNETLPPIAEGCKVSDDVMVTFVPPNGSLQVTKRGFFCEWDGLFAIPLGWKEFNGKLLPNGFFGRHLPPEKIISWKAIIQ